jgi:hypothetical protein|tara:strand:+ start:202 stop:759 length:558 start_codon:yes stop_codon:yes gene_type:complete
MVVFSCSASLARMILRAVGWILIFLQFFIDEKWREQIIAAQTIYCAATLRVLRPFHIATIGLIAASSAEIIETDLIRILLLHVAIFSALFLEYKARELKTIGWVAVAWSIRWLGSSAFYDSPIRSSFKCILYIIVANLREMYVDANYYKCLWILIVHESCWILVPIQLLREIYQANDQKKEIFIV